MNKWLVANLPSKFKTDLKLRTDIGNSPEARANYLFNQLLQSRISLLPIEMQPLVYEKFKSATVTYHFPFAVWGSSGGANRDLTANAVTHGGLQDSPFVLSTLMHEFEHLIKYILFFQSALRGLANRGQSHLFCLEGLFAIPTRVRCLFYGMDILAIIA